MCSLDQKMFGWRLRVALSLLLATLALSACFSDIGDSDSNSSGDKQKPKGVIITLPPGTQIGKFTLNAPSTDVFPLHATLPIPEGLYPRTDGQVPFAITDSDGTTV